MSYRTLRVTAAALALAAVAALTASSAKAGKCSRASVSAAGKGLSINQAMARAKAKWQQRTEKRFGLLWSRWSWAERKSRRCRTAGLRKSCKVRAFPCKAL